MDKNAVTIFINLTPSYAERWIQGHSVNAITSARAQTYHPHDVAILKHDEGTPIWTMYQRCLDQCRTTYYAIIGGDDYISPEYIRACMEALKSDLRIAAVSTQMWLVNKDDLKFGYSDKFGAGVWRTEYANYLGGYQQYGDRKWGCAAFLYARAQAAGMPCVILPQKEYYYRIWYGSVSKSDEQSKQIDKKIAKRKKGEMMQLGGHHSD